MGATCLTPQVIPKVVVGHTPRIRVQELHLILHCLVLRRWDSGVASVLVSIEDEPEVGADPLVDDLFSAKLCQHL
jgi:hypothetical protein